MIISYTQEELETICAKSGIIPTYHAIWRRMTAEDTKKFGIEHYALVGMYLNKHYHICVINYDTNEYEYIEKSTHRDQLINKLLK